MDPIYPYLIVRYKDGHAERYYGSAAEHIQSTDDLGPLILIQSETSSAVYINPDFIQTMQEIRSEEDQELYDEEMEWSEEYISGPYEETQRLGDNMQFFFED